jgi:hypothetical protein
MSDPAEVILENVRLSYPNLFKAKGFGEAGEGEPKFSASFIIPKSDKKQVAKIQKAIEAVSVAKWKDNVPKLKEEKVCLKDGDDKEDPAYEGAMYINASSRKRPNVLDRDKSPLDAEDGKPYGGCYVDAIIRIWAQDNKYGKRINASLEVVRFRKDGEAFGAAPASADALPDLGDDDDDVDDRPVKKRASVKDDDDDEDDRPVKKKARRVEEDEDNLV